MRKNLLILGAGQYGKVAQEVAQSMDCFGKIDFLDDNNDCAIGKLADYKKLKSQYTNAFVAIGNTDVRLQYIQELEESHFEVAILISPKAYVSSSARLQSGSIVEPMAVVNANSAIGMGVFVCAGAVVNHNSVVEDGCQLDCGSVVGSNAILPEKTKLQYNEVFEKEHLKFTYENGQTTRTE